MNDLEIVYAKNGQAVPQIGNTVLHSMYDPTLEAKRFVTSYETQLMNNNKFLIFGIGFAYHINEIIQFFEHKQIFKFEIVVIEPNVELAKKATALIKPTKGHITVYKGQNLESYYSNMELLNFLVQKPTILTHLASLNANEDFFKSFMKFKASKTLKSIIKSTQDKELKVYLENFNDNYTLKDISRQIAETTITNNFDYLILTLGSMVNH
jgi:hypothetical protein